MDFRGLVKATAALLRDNNIKKPTIPAKHTLHITDDTGNTADFVIKHGGGEVIYTIDDVEAILKACLQIIQSTLQLGDAVAIRGFGKFAVRYREPRKTRSIETGEWINIPGVYVPKFDFGNDLRSAARLYAASLKEGKIVTRIDREYGEDFTEEDDL